MDGTPLDEAYTAAKNADAAVIAGDFQKASRLFNDAAAAFDRVASQAPDNPAGPTLRALASQSRSRAAYFASDQAQEDARKPSTAQVARAPQAAPSTQAPASAGAAAVANGGSGAQAGNGAAAIGNNTMANAMANSVIAAPFGDAVGNLVMRSAAVFARTLEQVIAEKGGIAPSQGYMQPHAPAGGQAAFQAGPSESFYLVKPKSAKDEPQPDAASRISLSTLDRAQAIEAATKAQRSVLRTGLQQIKNEIALREQHVLDEHTEEVDRLRAENDRLKIQVSKLKSRWEGLKESARKRQNPTE